MSESLKPKHAHRMVRRGPQSCYWDCLNCGDYLCDVSGKPNRRITSAGASFVLGKCKGPAMAVRQMVLDRQERLRAPTRIRSDHDGQEK
jgi:hypothetical protein